MACIQDSLNKTMKNENRQTVSCSTSIIWCVCVGLLLSLPSYNAKAAGPTPSNGAVPIKLKWDASPTPGVTNYNIYASTNSLSASNLLSAEVRVALGTNLTATVYDLVPGKWYFAATAQLDGIESAPSNILMLEVPKSPTNFLTVFVQYSGTITNGFTDTGFFRLRIP